MKVPCMEPTSAMPKPSHARVAFFFIIIQFFLFVFYLYDQTLVEWGRM